MAVARPQRHARNYVLSDECDGSRCVPGWVVVNTNTNSTTSPIAIKAKSRATDPGYVALWHPLIFYAPIRDVELRSG